MTSIIPTIQPSIFQSIEGSILSPFGAPSLTLDFASNAYSMGAIGSVPSDRTFANLITFSRASGGGRVNPAGQLEWVGNDVPRFTYDPVTLQPLGLLIEEQRTNLLLQSAVLATQNVTVTAVAHTLSFYGAGTVTLSGVATGSKTGTGAYPAISTLTFTPTAGTLTLTVTGSVTFGQLEAGAFSTSYIPTTTAQVTRAADSAAVNTLSPWYNATEGTLVFMGRLGAPSTVNRYAVSLSTPGTLNNRIDMFVPASDFPQFRIVSSGATQFSAQVATPAGTGERLLKLRWKQGADAQGEMSGLLTTLGSAASVPSVTTLRIGGGPVGPEMINGPVASIEYYPRSMA